MDFVKLTAELRAQLDQVGRVMRELETLRVMQGGEKRRGRPPKIGFAVPSVKRKYTPSVQKAATAAA